MPNYDFRCDDCGRDFEKNVPLADYDKFQTCPFDNGKARRILKGAPGTAFRGTGWTPKRY